ncbi:hypothetical protein IW256_002476 [Actinomadura viridis]|uniref:Uncharacterized protein n=1 Tax=Actinomadura viridis TaxID=58110 RepID=A0A931DGT9_9ACTN|nr:hypothetical protein [Actinomadura viridis]
MRMVGCVTGWSGTREERLAAEIGLADPVRAPE